MENVKKNDNNVENEKDFIGETKSCTFEVALQQLRNKIYELELLEKMSTEAEKKLRNEEKELKSKERRLEETEYEIWQGMESFCDEIWQFSASNDLCAILNKYLDTPWSANQKFVSFDIELDADVLDLKNENNKLREQLSEKKLFLRKLQEDLLETEFSHSEIMRLKKSIEKLESELNGPASKLRKIEGEVFESREDRKSNFATATELIEISKNSGTTKGHFEKKKFSVKKESEISRRLANIRGLHRHE